MKKRLFLYFIYVFSGLIVYSFQAAAQISGRVIDDKGNPSPFCNVVLAKIADTTVISGNTTDVSGNFKIEIKEPGTFRLVVDYIGYKKFYSQPIVISTEVNQYNAGTITLETNTKMLNAVEVVALKPFIEYKPDRTVYNIENSVISSGNNGLEILSKLPGVTVSTGDAISVRGRPGVLIMIDGRTSYMSAADAANYLKSLDASQIEKIEVITNPSAKYDASGNAIINIVLKKDKNYGLNAQISGNYAQGFYNGEGGGITGNYRTKKFNFFGALHSSRVKRFNASDQENTFGTNGVPSTVLKDSIYNIHKGFDYSGRFGIDFNINDKQTIGIVMDGYSGAGTLHLNDYSKIHNAGMTGDSSLFTEGMRDIRASNINYDLNYKFKVDTTGKELSANADYASITSSSKETDVSNYYYALSQYQGRPTSLQYNLPSTITILAAQVDYSQPVNKKGKLEAGLKGSSVQTDNNAQYWNVLQGVPIADSGKTNHFIYSENLYSGYLNFSRSFGKKVDAQVGVRGEDTQSKSLQTLNSTRVKRNYFNLFPSGFISWKADSLNTFNASYSRRIDRPDYSDLNPFRFFHNPYNYTIGNPYLKPQLSDNYEINHVFKGFFTTSIGYLHMTDVITPAIHYDDATHISQATDQNLSTYNCYNIMVSAILHPVKFWTSTNSADLFHDHYFGLNQEGYYSKKQYTVICNSLNTFSLKKGWSIEISFFYRSLNINALVSESPIYRLDAGIKKQFANNRGTVSLNCSDVLWSDRMTTSEKFQTINYQSSFYQDSRRIRLAFSWKLGRSQYEREERSKSAQDEMKRVK